MSAHTGGCQCGAVRYRIEGELRGAHLCHCRMCQKAVGNYFIPLADCARDELTITRGEPAWFHSSDPVRRGFCRECGTPLLFDAIDWERINVVLGSLDDPAAVEPADEYGIEARMPWLHRAVGRDGPTTEDNEAPDMLARINGTNRQHPDHDTERWPPARGPA